MLASKKQSERKSFFKEVFQLQTLTDPLVPYTGFSYFSYTWHQEISYRSSLTGKEGCQSADSFKRTGDSNVSSKRTTKQSFRFSIMLKAKTCLQREISSHTDKSTVPSATAWFDRYFTEGSSHIYTNSFCQSKIRISVQRVLLHCLSRERYSGYNSRLKHAASSFQTLFHF